MAMPPATPSFCRSVFEFYYLWIGVEFADASFQPIQILTDSGLSNGQSLSVKSVVSKMKPLLYEHQFFR